MLRLRIRIERVDGSKHMDSIAIANSGFVGLEPELLIPSNLANRLKLYEVSEPETHTKVTGDGRVVEFIKYRNSIRVYVLAEDRVEGPILASAIVSSGSKHILLNDKLFR